MAGLIDQIRRLLEEDSKKKTKKASATGKAYSVDEEVIHVGTESENAIRSSVIECVPTGLADLDLIMAKDQKGVYGLPTGKQLEISGSESVGKSTLVYHLIRAWQNYFGEKALVHISETESSLDWHRMSAFGVNTEAVLWSQPEYIENGFGIWRKVLRWATDLGARPLLIWDSIGMASAKASMEADDSKSGGMIGEARAIARGLRKITGVNGKAGGTIIWVNHLMANPNAMWGKKTTTPGGKKLRHACNVRLEMTRVGKAKDGEEDIGIITSIQTVKNKLYRPNLRVDELPLYYESGFDPSKALLLALLRKEIAKKLPKGIIKFSVKDKEYETRISAFDEFLYGKPKLARKLYRMATGAKGIDLWNS